MSRLYDRMRRSGALVFPPTQEGGPSTRDDAFWILDHALRADERRGVVVVQASEMFWQYWITFCETGNNGLFDPTAGQVLAPPFECFLVEARIPGGVAIGSPEYQARTHAVGLLIWAADLWGYDNEIGVVTQEGAKVFIDKDEVRWRCCAVVLVEGKKGGMVLPFSVYDWYVGPEGRLTKAHSDRWIRETDLLGAAGLGVPDSAFSVVSGSILRWALQVMALLNCKNVEREEHVPPEKLSRKHERRFGKPLTRYYTLNLPGVSDTRRADDTPGTGPKGVTALHLCRGHFKTYTDKKPLFGKRTGTYWWPQTVRGSKKRGEVIKDYAVKAPNGGAS